MSKVAIVFWSGTGNTEQMAAAVKDGVVANGGEGYLIQCGGFDVSKISDYDSFAFGCPSMGSEVLEESEFEPMFSSCRDALKGKKVGLFGSYGWGDGEWMRNWEADCKSAGIALVDEGVICLEAPGPDTIKALNELGKDLV